MQAVERSVAEWRAVRIKKDGTREIIARRGNRKALEPLVRAKRVQAIGGDTFEIEPHRYEGSITFEPSRYDESGKPIWPINIDKYRR